MTEASSPTGPEGAGPEGTRRTRDSAADHSPSADPTEDSVWDRVEEEVEDAAERLVEGFEHAIDRTLPPHLRARLWARRRRTTHVMWRAGVLIVGMSVLMAGVAMLVLPGPGWAAIILGLVILASEYAWARRVLEPVKRWARRAADLALDPRRRRRNLVIVAVVGAVAAIAGVWYLRTYGLTWAPVTDLFGVG